MNTYPWYYSLHLGLCSSPRIQYSQNQDQSQEKKHWPRQSARFLLSSPPPRSREICLLSDEHDNKEPPASHFTRPPSPPWPPMRTDQDGLPPLVNRLEDSTVIGIP